MTKKTIEIFRAGTHTAMDGKSYTFTRDDLLATAAAYDPAVFSAPAVIGHPKVDDPAYGWVTGLRVDGDVLLADLDQVDPAFAEIVNAGRYKKVSPWFYPPEGKSNPVPGAYYPRHIGFLGAAAPGCQGLTPVAFADGEEELVAFSDAEVARPVIWLARMVGRMFRRMRDAAIAEKGVEEANKMFPEWEQDAPGDIAAELQRILDEPAPGFTAPADETAGVRFAAATPEPSPTGADPDDAAARLAEREAAVAAREAEIATRDAAFAAAARESRLAEDDAFLDHLIGEGRLPPGLKPQFAAFCEALGDAEGIAFSEGADPENPRDRFRALLSQSLGVAIRFDEIAEGEGARFAEGQSADDLAAAARARVAEARERGETLSVSSAMAAITAGR